MEHDTLQECYSFEDLPFAPILQCNEAECGVPNPAKGALTIDTETGPWTAYRAVCLVTDSRTSSSRLMCAACKSKFEQHPHPILRPHLADPTGIRYSLPWWTWEKEATLR